MQALKILNLSQGYMSDCLHLRLHILPFIITALPVLFILIAPGKDEYCQYHHHYLFIANCILVYTEEVHESIFIAIMQITHAIPQFMNAA